MGSGARLLTRLASNTWLAEWIGADATAFLLVFLLSALVGHEARRAKRRRLERLKLVLAHIASVVRDGELDAILDIEAGGYVRKELQDLCRETMSRGRRTADKWIQMELVHLQRNV